MNQYNFPPDRDDCNLPSELKSFEARLKELLPRGDRINRDRLIFFAGRASVESNHDLVALTRSVRTRNGWSAALASVTTAALLVLAFFILKAGNNTVSPSQAGGDAITRPIQPSIHSNEMNAASLGAAKSSPRTAREVDASFLRGQFSSITTRDVQLVNDAAVASNSRGLTGGQSIYLGQDEVRGERRVLTPSAWERVFNEL